MARDGPAGSPARAFVLMPPKDVTLAGLAVRVNVPTPRSTTRFESLKFQSAISSARATVGKITSASTAIDCKILLRQIRSLGYFIVIYAPVGTPAARAKRRMRDSES